jgi:hypothetical protein
MATRTKIAGLPIQKEWLVIGVREGVVESNPNGGDLQKFYVDFEGAEDVYWRRKLPATVEVGKSYFGTISEGQHGPIFKKETPQQGGGGGGQSSTATRSSGGSNRDWKPESQYDPEKTARIGRAHAQEMAIRTLVGNGEKFNTADVAKLASEYEADVNAAGQKAAQGAGSSGTTAAPQGTAPAGGSTPGPGSAQKPPPDDEHQHFCSLLESQAMTGYGASKLATFIMQRLDQVQRVRAHNGLADPQTAATVLGELRAAYTAAEGEPVPEAEAGDGDDIPF